jgi:hypothetical protein
MKKLLLILLLVLAGEISAQQAATIVVKTTPDNEIAYWPTGKEHLFCIALGTKAQAENLSINSAPTAPAWCRYGPKGVILLHST